MSYYQLFNFLDSSINFISFEFLGHKMENGNGNSNKNHDELQYLNLIQRIIDTGNAKGDRTGTGTMSLFGAQMRFDLRDGTFPLLTTKKVFWRGIAEELFWYIHLLMQIATIFKKSKKHFLSHI